MRTVRAGAAALEEHAMALGFQRGDAFHREHLGGLAAERRIGGDGGLHRVEPRALLELDVDVALALGSGALLGSERGAHARQALGRGVMQGHRRPPRELRGAVRHEHFEGAPHDRQHARVPSCAEDGARAVARGKPRELGVMRLERVPVQRRAFHDGHALLQQRGRDVERSGGGNAYQRHIHGTQVAHMPAAAHRAGELEVREVACGLRARAAEPAESDDREAKACHPASAGRKIRAMDWLPFEQLDRMRRLQGSLLDAAGLGPVETPYEVAHAAPGVTLRRYGGGDDSRPPVLIVTAPIKRPYIWDLAPEVSAVRRCLSRGARVFLLEWQPAAPQLGLADYAERLISECLDAAGIERAILLSHSLGGLFAAIFATLHPERVQGLGLLAAPLHFGADAPVLSAMVAQIDPERLPDALPGSFLGLASLNADPGSFGTERLADALRSAWDPAALRTHLLVERWALDEFALPRSLVADLARLVRGDDFLQGTLDIGGRRAAPSQLAAPLLCVLDPRCRVVPPATMLAFVEAAASTDKTVLRYDGDVGVSLQHLGPLVGRRAHALLWPRILDWMRRIG